MDKDLSLALIDFYHKLLRPELAGIKEKLQDHDEKFIEMLGHFDGVHKRLDNLEAEYHSINGGLGRMEKRQDGLENRFVGLEKKFDGLENRFDGLEKKFDGLENRFDGLEKKFDGLEKKLDGVAADLGEHRRDTEAHRKGWRVREE